MRSCSKSRLWNFEHFCAFRQAFFALSWMKIYCYWSSCQVSFIWLPLFGNFRFKSEQNFGTPNFCIFNLRRPTWFVYLVYSLPWNIFYCVLFSFYRPFEEGTRWALNLHSKKPFYLKIIGLFLLSFWCTNFHLSFAALYYFVGRRKKYLISSFKSVFTRVFHLYGLVFL